MTGSKGKAPVQEYLLASLAHPRLGGSIPGLALVDGRLEPRGAHFPCCAGRGLRFSPDGNTTYSCKLGERLRETRRLAQLLASLSGAELGACLPQEVRPSAGLSQALEVVHLIAKSSSKRGLGWIEAPASAPATGASASGSPSSVYPSMWALALAASWRFGLKVHVVHLQGSLAGELIPAADKPAPDLICIGRAGSFWDPHTVEKLETLINYAYSALIPVMIQIVVVGSPPAAKVKPYGKVEAVVAQRLAAARAKSPLAWLPPACLAKLLAVTSGLTPPLPAGGGGTPKEAKPASPRLGKA